MLGRKEERKREDVTEKTIGVGDGCRPIVASSAVVLLVMGCWQWVTDSSVIDG